MDDLIRDAGGRDGTIWRLPALGDVDRLTRDLAFAKLEDADAEACRPLVVAD